MFKETNSCAILVIYCKILFIYVFEVLFFFHFGMPQTFPSHRPKDVCGWKTCKPGMYKCLSFRFVATCGRQESLTCDRTAAVNRTPTGMCVFCSVFASCYDGVKSLLFLFFRRWFKLVCMFKFKKEKLQERTHRRLCTIVIFECK